MLAVSPLEFSNYGWLLDDPMSHIDEENMSFYFNSRSADQMPQSSESIDLIHSPINSSKSQPQIINGGESTVKKLNHNASERDRRKKMNTLYATLRSLLPADDQSKKLSIPATISRVLKYIPELQKEVERLIQKKERFMSKITSSFPHEIKHHHKMRPTQNPFSATRINEAEIVIQISMPKAEKASFSEAIMRLEEEGFLMLNASCFESFEGRLFYNLHLQAQEGQVIDAEKLKEKAWPFI